MNVANGNVCRSLETSPGCEESVAQASVEKPRPVARGFDLNEQRVEACKVALGQSAAVFTRGDLLSQDFRARICSYPPDGSGFGDANPHFEIECLLDEHVFLGGEKPQQIAVAYPIFAIGQQVNTGALCHEIEFQFGVMVHRMNPPEIAVIP